MKILNFLKKERTISIFILTGFIIIIPLMVVFLWKENTLDTGNLINAEKFGQFGDFVGGVIGSLWSFAGILLFYLALTEQRDDFKTNQEALRLQVEALNQQIEEFQLQRQELESTRKIYEEQSQTLKIQQFESNFYSFLEVYSNIKTRFPECEENDFFNHLYNKLYLRFDPQSDFVHHHGILIKRYITLFNLNSGLLSHYFKSFYRIVKMVDTQPYLKDGEKSFYMKILRSQLTDYEQLLLFYNSCTMYGEKARPLILKYDLLKHIPSFKKPEYQYYQDIQGGDDLILFTSWLGLFLKRNIPFFYNLEFEEDKIDEQSPYFNCIVRLSFEENITLKIYCDNDLSKCGILLSDQQFQDFMVGFILDRIQITKYLDIGDIEIVKQVVTSEKRKVFEFEIIAKQKIDG